jgi:ubiquitin thioesterase protein OTUB1
MENTPSLPRPTDEDILVFENQIRESEVNVHPLIGEPLPIDSLAEEYASGENVNFLLKIGQIADSFVALRRTRGDGNCFFRAFSFGFIEAICALPVDVREAVTLTLRERIEAMLKSAGFDRMAYEDFFDELFLTIKDFTLHSSEWLAQEWSNQPHRSHSLVVLLRLVASAYLRAHAEEYEPFLWEVEGGEAGMITYCQRHVECLGVESDQIHIIALSKALDCDVEIAYLDGNPGQLDRMQFLADDNSTKVLRVQMLYRPGHYDLLYPKSHQT